MEQIDIEDLLAVIIRHEKCFVRIARAVGITTPLELIAMAKNDEETYAEILTRYVESIFSN